MFTKFDFSFKNNIEKIIMFLKIDIIKNNVKLLIILKKFLKKRF